MRLAVLGYSHETNTFAAHPTPYESFSVDRGQEVVRKFGDAHSTVTGFLQAGDRFGFEAVPLYFAQTNPSGTITRDAFERIASEMLRLLERHGPWDGILLALHGAAVAEDFPDADGEMAARVRGLVGERTPIGMALDLHGNLSQKMVDAVNATVFYRTNPHLDPTPRALECADIIVRTIKGEISPVQALEMPPMVINIVRQFTGEEPMLGLMQDADEVIARPGILSASVVEGYPYADVAEMGMSFLVVADGDQAAARDAAQWLARRAWRVRHDFVGDVPSPSEAIRRAASAPRGPVVLMDVGDNIGGGSPGDSTILLAEAMHQGVRDYLQTLHDPEAVATCAHAGAGADVELLVGGKADDSPGKPVRVRGRVRLLSDGTFEEPNPTHGGGRYFDGGTTAVLETEDGFTLVLTSKIIGNTSIQQMYALGIRPEAKQVVVAKGVVSPRPAYQPIAAEIILVNTPGVTTADLSTFAYHRRRQPLFPFEQDATYEV